MREEDITRINKVYANQNIEIPKTRINEILSKSYSSIDTCPPEYFLYDNINTEIELKYYLDNLNKQTTNLDTWENEYKKVILQVPSVHKLMKQRMFDILLSKKKFSYNVVTHIRKYYGRQVYSKGKRLVREVAMFSKKYDKDRKEYVRKVEKAAMEKRRCIEESKEVLRQKRKFEYLLSQTELFSQFMLGKKDIGSFEKKDGDNEFVALSEKFKKAASKAIEEKSGVSGGKKGDNKRNGNDLVSGSRNVNDLIDGNVNGSRNGTDLINGSNVNVNNKFIDGSKIVNRTNSVNGNVNLMNNNEVKSHTIVSEGIFNEPHTKYDSDTINEDKLHLNQPKMLNCELKNYQITGFNWLAKLYNQGINGILADDMGLGKTVQSISLLAYLAETEDIWGPFLIVTPVSTLHNWEQELKRFIPQFKVLNYWGTANTRNQSKHEIKNSNIILTSYQIAVADFKILRKITWAYMILDEAQAIKSSASKRWTTLLSFKTKSRLLLTGTPVQNTMSELWALLHFIMPTLFDSLSEFTEWFSKGIEESAERKKAVDEIQLQKLHAILKPFMLRRLKTDVKTELGEKKEIEMYCDLSIRQKIYYESIIDACRSYELENIMMQLRKVCNHPDLFEKLETTTKLSMYRFEECGRTLELGRSKIQLKIPLLVADLCKERRELFDRNFCIENGLIYKNELQILFNKKRDFLYENLCFLLSESGCNKNIDRIKFDVLGKLFKDRKCNFIGSSDGIKNDIDFNKDGDFNLINNNNKLEDSIKLKNEFKDKIKLNDLISNDNKVKDSINLEDKNFNYNKNDNKVKDSIKLNDIKLESNKNDNKLESNKDNIQLNDNKVKNKNFNSNKNDNKLESTSLYETSFYKQLSKNVKEKMNSLKKIPVITKNILSSFPYVYTNNGEYLPKININLPLTINNVVNVPPLNTFIIDSGKFLLLDRLLTKLKQENHRILLYFQMTKMMDLVEDYLVKKEYSYCRLDGSSKISYRRDTVNDWQTGDKFIFLLSTRAGGLGINLTAADTVIFYDSDWNPTVDQQAMDRAYRIGQTKDVTVYRLITRNTIEERVMEKALHKGNLQKMVIKGKIFEGLDY